MDEKEKLIAARYLRLIGSRLLMMEETDCFHAGLCAVAVSWYGVSSWTYVTRVIKPHVKKTGKNAGFLCEPGMHWEQRAMFALLLAESLEKP